MAGSKDFISKVINIAKKNSFAGYWELIAAAAGDYSAMQNCCKAVSIQELKQLDTLKHIDSPSFLKDRIEAMTVCANGWACLHELWKSLADEPVNDPFGNPWIRAAKFNISSIIEERGYVNYDMPAWRWEDHVDMKPSDIERLKYRPLINKSLSENDIEQSIMNGGLALIALSYQEVDIDKKMFLHWVDKIDRLGDSLPILVSLCCKYGGDIEPWREAYIPILSDLEDPRDAIPTIYYLLNPKWQIERDQIRSRIKADWD